jgi:choline kinase
MKAIILSAGQGRRLLPLTEREPKCLLAVDGRRPVLEVQLDTLARCGVGRATVVVGFGARHVERFLHSRPVPGLEVETLYNPFYASSDNLATCWLARHQMDQDFLLINGDTLFEDEVVRRVLAAPPAPVVVTIDRKASYDDDDMKVAVDDAGRLLAIGKTLEPEMVVGESIGLLRFRGAGPKRFCVALEHAIRAPGALKAWYLSVVNELAQDTAVDTVSIQGAWWREIDSREDLDEVRRSFPRGRAGDAACVSAAGS